MSNIWEAIGSIAAAIVGVAILSVLVSQRSNTANVLRAAGGAFSQALGTAVSPVTGASTYPTGTMGYQPTNFSSFGY